MNWFTKLQTQDIDRGKLVQKLRFVFKKLYYFLYLFFKKIWIDLG